MERNGGHIERDKALVEAAQAGDRGAFSELVSHYQSPLLNYILEIVPSEEDAEDIIQESFQKLYTNLHRYNSKWAFSTWLYTIAQNSAFDWLRKKQLSSLSSIVGKDYEQPAVEDSQPNPEESMILNQAVEGLLKSIKQLSHIYREVAELRFIQGFPISEIATKLNIPENTVKTRIRRAKGYLLEIYLN